MKIVILALCMVLFAACGKKEEKKVEGNTGTSEFSESTGIPEIGSTK